MSCVLLNGAVLGVTFGTGMGGKTVTQNYTVSASALAVVANIIKTAMSF